jgi:hypothetical protein
VSRADVLDGAHRANEMAVRRLLGKREKFCGRAAGSRYDNNG